VKSQKESKRALDVYQRTRKEKQPVRMKVVTFRQKQMIRIVESINGIKSERKQKRRAFGIVTLQEAA
jgi:hypothetical protein